MKEQLKECPFCGEHKLLEVSAKERKDRPKCRWIASVTCLICGGRAIAQGFWWTEDEARENATKAWNRRRGVKPISSYSE